MKDLDPDKLDRWITGNYGWDYGKAMGMEDEGCDGSGWILVQRSGLSDPDGYFRVVAVEMSTPCPGCRACQEPPEPDPDRAYDEARERRAWGDE